MKSSRTKSLQKKLHLLRIADIIILMLPLFVYFIIGMANNTVVTVDKKVALLGSFVIALALTGYNFIKKLHLRSPLWIILIGVYYALHDIVPLLFCLAIGSILDEFYFTPMIKRTKAKLITNREIDLREEENE